MKAQQFFRTLALPLIFCLNSAAVQASFITNDTTPEAGLNTRTALAATTPSSMTKDQTTSNQALKENGTTSSTTSDYVQAIASYSLESKTTNPGPLVLLSLGLISLGVARRRLS